MTKSKILLTTGKLFILVILLLLSLAAIQSHAENYAIRLDGVDDYIKIPHHSSFNWSQQATIECWVRIFDSNGGRVFNKWREAVEDKQLRFEDTRKVTFHLHGLEPAGINRWSRTVLNVDQWYHITGTARGDSLFIYINGYLDTCWAASGSWIGNSTDPARIGAAYNRPGCVPINGEIDELRIWNIYKTPEEIRSMMFQEASGNEPGLVAVWHFNEGQGQTAYDPSPNHNNGRLGSSTGGDPQDPQWVYSTSPINTPDSIPFALAVNYGACNQPISIFCADLDGDGDMDLAVANYWSDNVSILKNNGDGTFQTKVDYPAGIHPSSVFCADLDGDGDMDLAVANAGSDNVSILKNNGDGIFQTKVDYPAGDRPFSVFCADLDRDGDVDIAVSHGWSDNVSILKNNGDGIFQLDSNYDAGDSATSIFCADLDGNGDMDLAVANEYSDNVSILKNNGDGTFQTKVDYGAGIQPMSVFCADLDGDNDLDLAVANHNSDNISIMKNNGDGSFRSEVRYRVGTYPSSIFCADLDGDQDLDLAVANWLTNNVSILKNLSNQPIPGTIDGNVKDANTQQNLQGVLVEVLQGSQVKGSDNADVNGNYSISNLPAGSYDVRAKKIGYETKTYNSVQVNVNQTTTQNFNLNPVPDHAVFSDDFSDGNDDGWEYLVGSCSWSVQNGEYSASNSGNKVWCISATGDPNWSNYIFEADVLGLDGVNKVLIFHLQDANNFYAVNLRSDWGGLDEVTFNKMGNGVFNADIVRASYPSINGVWYHLKIACVDETFTVFVDDNQVLQYTDNENILYEGRIGLACWTGDASICSMRFDNVLIADPFPYIVFDNVTGQNVGDYVTFQGRLQYVDASPYVPPSGYFGVEDPITKMSSLVSVSPNGSFTYSTSRGADRGSAYLFIFGCTNEYGAVRFPFDITISNPAVPQNDISRLNYSLETGPLTQPLESHTKTLSVKKLLSAMPTPQEVLKETFSSFWGGLKGDIAAGWKRHTESGIGNAITEVREWQWKKCKETPLNVGNCATAAAALAWQGITFTVADPVIAKLDEGISLLDQVGLPPCAVNGARTGLEVGDFAIGLLTADPTSSELLNGFDDLSGNIDFAGSLLEVIDDGIKKGCPPPLTGSNFPAGSLGFIATTPSGEMFMVGLVPKYQKVVTIKVFSPIDLIVSDPLGRIVSKDSLGVPGAEYNKTDFNLDGHNELVIIMPIDSVGEVNVSVIPDSTAQPNDTFSIFLDYSYFSSPIALAENLRISEIPPTGFPAQVFENLPPDSFSLQSPSDSSFVSLPFSLAWSQTVDPNPGHSVSYELYLSKNLDFSDSIFIDSLSDTTTVIDSVMLGNHYGYNHWKVRAHDAWGAGTWSTQVFTVYVKVENQGDVNRDGVIDIGDVVFLINYLYKNGSAPNPLPAGDANCDGVVDVGDVVFLINYLFKSGPSPCSQ